VALQGTIDSFALSDVLRLLNASGKTGRLIVNGDRGSASLWMVDGQLVGGSTSGEPHAPEIVDVVFDVLRFGQGSFIFENDARCPNPSEPMLIIPALEQAEAALAEWLEIIRVVPSLDSVVTLAPELPHPEVVVDQACWTSIVAVGGTVTVIELGNRLGLGELPVCRLVRALVSAGFVAVGPPAQPEPEPAPEPEPEVVAELEHEYTEEETVAETDSYDEIDHIEEEGPIDWSAPFSYSSDPSPAAADPVPAATSSPATEFVPLGDPANDLGAFGDPLTGPDAPHVAITGLTDDPFAPESFPAGSSTSLFDRRDGDTATAAEDEEDWSQALSMLSPKAAQAVAAASGDETEDRNDDGVF
jgi:Domain of unknown function (DUF4388)